MFAPVRAGDLQSNILCYARLQVAAEGVFIQAVTTTALHVTLEKKLAFKYCNWMSIQASDEVVVPTGLK